MKLNFPFKGLNSQKATKDLIFFGAKQFAQVAASEKGFKKDLKRVAIYSPILWQRQSAKAALFRQKRCSFETQKKTSNLRRDRLGKRSFQIEFAAKISKAKERYSKIKMSIHQHSLIALSIDSSSIIVELFCSFCTFDKDFCSIKVLYTGKQA